MERLASTESPIPQDLTFRQRFLNSPAARRVTAAVAALGLMSGAGEMALNTEPVAADGPIIAVSNKADSFELYNLSGNFAPGSPEQVCAEAALVKPSILRPLVMKHPGAKPDSPKDDLHMQRVFGAVGYPDVQAQCSPEFTRIGGGMIQKRVGYKWFNMDQSRWFGVSEYNGNQGGYAQVFMGEASLYPLSQYVKCIPGKGWQKVRILFRDWIKNNQTHKSIAIATYKEPVKIEGGNWCK